MNQMNDELFRLQRQIERAAQLRIFIPELQQRHERLTARVKGLEQALLREQRDVDRLEGWSLAALYYRAAGKQEDQLEKERREANAAQNEYDTATAELNGLDTELKQAESELIELADCEARYQALLVEKLAALKASGGEAAEHIHSMEERIGKLETRKKEVRDAIIAGNAALYAANQAKACLEGAKEQSIGDLATQGVLSGLFKHGKFSELEEAKSYAGEFRSRLSVFQNKLAQITVTTGIRVNVAEFRHFGDYFFDGLLADLSFHNKLSKALEELENANRIITNTINKLGELMTKLNKDQERTRAKLDKLVLKTK